MGYITAAESNILLLHEKKSTKGGRTEFKDDVEVVQSRKSL
jgi:hypothetical protein